MSPVPAKIRFVTRSAVGFAPYSLRPLPPQTASAAHTTSNITEVRNGLNWLSSRTSGGLFRARHATASTFIMRVTAPSWLCVLTSRIRAASRRCCLLRLHEHNGTTRAQPRPRPGQQHITTEEDDCVCLRKGAARSRRLCTIGNVASTKRLCPHKRSSSPTAPPVDTPQHLHTVAAPVKTDASHTCTMSCSA